MSNEGNGAPQGAEQLGVYITWAPGMAAARNEEGGYVEAAEIHASGWVRAFAHDGSVAWFSPGAITAMSGNGVSALSR